ncbi:unnamed protein product [Prorocentrum cordatum]|uniref:Uncharacterized protein n=1 Tax=Prorocentrum cordatum TaxID=2364126 RepID=A0ABN9VJW9_9DINO|nr:unnamed protein product [Polarella glacialis]
MREVTGKGENCGTLELNDLAKSITDLKKDAADLVNRLPIVAADADKVFNLWNSSVTALTNKLSCGSLLDDFAERYDITKHVETWDFQGCELVTGDVASPEQKSDIQNVDQRITQFPTNRVAAEKLTATLGSWAPAEVQGRWASLHSSLPTLQEKVHSSTKLMALLLLVPYLHKRIDHANTLKYVTGVLKLPVDQLPTNVRDKLGNKVEAKGAVSAPQPEGAPKDSLAAGPPAKKKLKLSTAA